MSTSGEAQFVITGVVVPGDRRGRELGFPTANVEVDAGVDLPPDGVYAGVIERAAGARHVAAISIGRRTTFHGETDGERLLEAYVLDFTGDLYGERIVVHIGPLVREQRTFETSEELVAQMHKDVLAVRGTGGSSAGAGRSRS